MEKDFTIDKAEWHTKAIRDYEFDNGIIYKYFENIIRYLQSNALTTRVILSDSQTANDGTVIKRSAVTDLGFALIQKSYSKRIDKVVDGKILPTDFSLLDKSLRKLREHKS